MHCRKKRVTLNSKCRSSFIIIALTPYDLELIEGPIVQVLDCLLKFIFGVDATFQLVGRNLQLLDAGFGLC